MEPHQGLSEPSGLETMTPKYPAAAHGDVVAIRAGAPPGPSRPQLVATWALAMALLLLGLYTLWSFLSALVWAGIFAVALWPLYCRVQRRFGTGKHNILLPSAVHARRGADLRGSAWPHRHADRHESHSATEWVRNAQANGIPEPDVLHTCRSARRRWTSGGRRTWPTPAAQGAGGAHHARAA